MSKTNPYFNPPRWMPTVLRQWMAYRNFNGDELMQMCLEITWRTIEKGGIFQTDKLNAMLLYNQFLDRSTNRGDGLMWQAWQELHGGKS